MGFDPFAEAANVATRSTGAGAGFKPGYPLIKVHHIQTRDNKERANYQVRYGQDGKRWMSNNIWGVGAINSKKSEDEQLESFKTNIMSLFQSVVVKEGDKYTSLFDYCKENKLGGGTSSWGGFADAICAESAKLGGQGKLFLRVVNRLRNSKITEDHVKMAKHSLQKYELNDYYSGSTGYVLFSEWKKVEGKTPGEKRLPETFAKVDALLSAAKGGGGSPGSTGASEAPPEDDDEDIPF